MKLIKKLKHTDKEMTNAVFGWDIFRCGDYSAVDNITPEYVNLTSVKSKIKKGHTIILAMNLGSIRFFKRSFIKI